MMLMIVPINEKHIEKTNHNMVLTINFRFNRVLYGMKIAINNRKPPIQRPHYLSAG